MNQIVKAERFVLAPDSFKESMSAKEVCQAMEEGIRRIYPRAECIHVPMADGGEGTLQALVDATKGEVFYKEVTGPLGESVLARYGVLGDGQTAVIEMAEAAGLALVPMEKRNPLITTTYGVGELIKAALDRKVSRLMIAIGGSATNDAGVGMLQALGASFQDKEGKEIGFGGLEVGKIERIDLSQMDKRLSKVNIEVACDVTNPLTGPNGASYVFAKQKGATKEMIILLEDALSHFAEVTSHILGKEIHHLKGAGAAGGLGAALAGFCEGQLVPGIDLVVKYAGLEEKLKGASVVFTGEGSIDEQTQYGKTITGVAKAAKQMGIPVIAIGGRVTEESRALYEVGVSAILGITPSAMTLDEAIAKGKEHMARTVENVCRLLLVLADHS